MALLNTSSFTDYTENQLREILERLGRRIAKVERENRKLSSQLATEKARGAINDSQPLKVQIATLLELNVSTNGIAEITGAKTGYIRNIKSQMGIKN